MLMPQAATRLGKNIAPPLVAKPCPPKLSSTSGLRPATRQRNPRGIPGLESHLESVSMKICGFCAKPTPSAAISGPDAPFSTTRSKYKETGGAGHHEQQCGKGS